MRRHSRPSASSWQRYGRRDAVPIELVSILSEVALPFRSAPHTSVMLRTFDSVPSIGQPSGGRRAEGARAGDLGQHASRIAPVRDAFQSARARLNAQGAKMTSKEQEVRKLFDSLLERWAAGDVEGYAALFAPDAHYVAFDGVDQHGREAIAAAHRPLFTRFLRGSRLIGEIASIDFLGPDVAVIHAYGYLVEKGRTEPKPSRLSTQTVVAHRREGVWQFVAFHNTRVRPVSGSPRAFLAWQLADSVWSLAARTPKPSDTGMPLPHGNGR